MQPEEPHLLPPNPELIEAYIMPKIGMVLYLGKGNLDANDKTVRVWVCDYGYESLLDKKIFFSSRKPALTTKENLNRIREGIRIAFTHGTFSQEDYCNDEHYKIDMINANQIASLWSDNDDYETKTLYEIYDYVCEMREQEERDLAEQKRKGEWRPLS